MTILQGHESHREFIYALLSATINAQGACGILINVTGTVKYEDSPMKRTFSQTFILMPDENQASNYYIQSDNFR